MENISQKKNILKNPFLIISMLFILTFASMIIYEGGFSLEVKLNGEVVGYAKNESTVETALEMVQNDVLAAYGDNAYFEKEVLTERVRGHKDEEIVADVLNDYISENIEVYKPASVIVIDKKEAVAVTTKRVAEEILEELKMPYQKPKGSTKVLDVYFSQDVEIIEKDVLVDNILNYELAVIPFRSVKNQSKAYKLDNGDSVYAIRPLASLSVDHPGVLNLDKDNLELSQIKLDVVSVVETKEKETIKYKTKKEDDKTLFVGTSKVTQKGVNGEKEITSKLTYINGKLNETEKVKEEVLKKAKTKKIAVGTKKRPVVVAKVNTYTGGATHVSGRAGTIVSQARSLVGVAPYRFGGNTPSGFDCSGFTQYVYGRAGVSIPRSASSQAYWGAAVSRANLQPGDLLLFKGQTGGGVGHAGIYIGNGQMIHASVPGTRINVTSINQSYFSSRFVTARRAS